MSLPKTVAIDLHAVIVAVTKEVPRILTVQLPGESIEPTSGAQARAPLDALASGPLDPGGGRTLELELRGWVREQTGLGLGYVEQLYTFGDRNRGLGVGAPGMENPDGSEGGLQSDLSRQRVISVAYLALVREAEPTGDSPARWQDGYRFLPWEDWREGRPSLLADAIGPGLERWIDASESLGLQRLRRERCEIAFGYGGVLWDEERVLERYELLYEAGMVEEALRDDSLIAASLRAQQALPLGEPMAFDHRRILATALGRLRGKLKYRPVVFELLPPTFTLFQLQRVVEALSGVRLHKQNFRRLVDKGGLVEGTGRLEPHTGGRPAELFRFRREALRERPAPGVGLPAARVGG
ncbi:MAG: hypothetical protein K0U98_28110 [Deltaproteobacteria bacterium]|nr:hypothetical protein [Deltaproteobacteria bacterium]